MWRRARPDARALASARTGPMERFRTLKPEFCDGTVVQLRAQARRAPLNWSVRTATRSCACLKPAWVTGRNARAATKRLFSGHPVALTSENFRSSRGSVRRASGRRFLGALVRALPLDGTGIRTGCRGNRALGAFRQAQHRRGAGHRGALWHPQHPHADGVQGRSRGGATGGRHGCRVIAALAGGRRLG
jgi:hypothetical protein